MSSLDTLKDFLGEGSRYLQLIHIVVQQRLTHHYKATLLQFKNQITLINKKLKNKAKHFKQKKQKKSKCKNKF